MDQEIRNKLRNVVTQCRKLLEDDTRDALEGKYAIFARKDQVTADPQARMTHLTGDEPAARQDILDHYAHIQARGFKPKDALDQLIREIAFTHLNRLCAYKMMEAREVYVGGQKFREAVSRGFNSNGVKFYLAEHPEDERLFNTGQQDVAYRHFLDWLGGALSNEIGVLFHPNDPANRLYPRQTTLDEVLDLLNGGGIKTDETDLREQWPQIWSQDETIGWVYQYFTPKELRDQARKESQAPRNSYELAFRNQFFTPRYVVEFLTDNTLGRIWYEMRKGDTKLKDQCLYLVRRPTEIFLNEGQQPPPDATEPPDDLSQEELLKLPVHIPHRPKKDPRELKILDPACGSGHFLLYCFDLLLTIYEEAYTDRDLGPALKKDYPTLEALQRDVPRLILAHNLHGIDIDLRASQIAALALWLRCQRAYQEMGLKKDRPQITRSNFVCAEPMPGEAQMLKEFVGQLEPKVLGQVVEVVFDKMKLAGEAGSLLKIEEEIRDAIREAKRQYAIGGIKVQRTFFDKPTEPVAKVFSVKDITDAQFFVGAEEQVIEALRSYAEKAQNGHRLQRRLFTEDAERGFAFVDLCQKRYDVVLMNPPFGEFTVCTRELANDQYSAKSNEILAAMVERGCFLLVEGGRLGAITSRTAFFAPTTANWRQNVVLPTGVITWVELGSGVLDTAMVETCMFTLGNIENSVSTFIRPSRNLSADAISLHDSRFYRIDSAFFHLLEGNPFAYWLSARFFWCLKNLPSLALANAFVKVGLQTGDDFRFIRLASEVSTQDIPSVWRFHAKGGDNSPFYSDLHLVVNWKNDGAAIKEHPSVRLNMYSPVQKKFHFAPGLTFSYRTHRFSPAALPPDCITGVAGMGVFTSGYDLSTLLGLLNSSVVNEFISARLGQLESQSLYQAGTIMPTPLPEIDAECSRQLASLAESAYQILRRVFISDELSPFFAARLPTDLEADVVSQSQRSLDELVAIYDQIDEIARKVYGFGTEDLEEIINRWRETFRSAICVLLRQDHSTPANVFSILVGHIFGRWDIRVANIPDDEKVGGLFDPLPSAPPGMLVNSDEVPPNDYPLRIDRNGVLVDDPESSDDIVRRVQNVLEIICNEKAESIEQRACELLSVNELRDYFRKPGKGGFWDDHISRYTKSRRKAPIYWLLQSAKRNYAIWLYYHRLDKDLLFKALVNYVEPKIRLETSRLESLRSQKAATGQSGKEAKRLAKEVERQEDFLSELRDFEDKLRRAANRHLEPDLNDGVVLNIAPLWELVPWKEAKTYWDELLAGKYEWSSIGKQLRERGLVK
jgi:hypothetical protein